MTILNVQTQQTIYRHCWRGKGGLNLYEVLARDGNLNPIRGYSVRFDPNGPNFTRFDKE